MSLIDYKPRDIVTENGRGTTPTTSASKTGARSFKVSQATICRDLQTIAGRDQVEALEREVALAGSRIEQLEQQLIAAGATDPELGP